MTLNEWGVPDWQEAGPYENNNWNINQWRWQFLRRRHDLREDFDKKCGAEYEDVMERFRANPEHFGNVSPATPDQPGFWVTTKLIHKHPEKLPNPRISDQPFYAISWGDVTASHKRHYSEKPPENFMRFDFDLTRPIEPQLKTAKEFLRDYQKHKVGKNIQVRQHRDKWPIYLRVLDARDAGASWAEIATILTHSAATEQNARDVYRQATDLCFNFPI